jgi:hypothetical protein
METNPVEQVWLPGFPEMVPRQSCTLRPVTFVLPVLQTLNASLTVTWTSLPDATKHDLQAFVMVSPEEIVGEQAEPQSAHSLLSLVGGFVPHTTFKGVPPELEEAAAEILFFSVVRRVDETNEPLYDTEFPDVMGPVG